MFVLSSLLSMCPNHLGFPRSFIYNIFHDHIKFEKHAQHVSSGQKIRS